MKMLPFIIIENNIGIVVFYPLNNIIGRNDIKDHGILTICMTTINYPT